MKLKILLSTMLFMTIFVHQAQADRGAQASFDILYPANAQPQCFVCHNSAPTAAPVQLSLYGLSYKTKGGSKNGGTDYALRAIESLDADNDGFANIFEIRSGTNLSSALVLPAGRVDPTKQVMARHTPTASVQSVTVTAVTDLYTATNDTYTLAVGREILGGINVKLTLSSAGSVILAFAEAPVPLDAKVYEVPATGAATQAPFTVSTSGEVTITTISATPTLIVERTAPPAEVAPPTVTCLLGQASTVATFVLLLLSLGFMLKRKQV